MKLELHQKMENTLIIITAILMIAFIVKCESTPAHDSKRVEYIKRCEQACYPYRTGYVNPTVSCSCDMTRKIVEIK